MEVTFGYGVEVESVRLVAPGSPSWGPRTNGRRTMRMTVPRDPKNLRFVHHGIGGVGAVGLRRMMRLGTKAAAAFAATAIAAARTSSSQYLPKTREATTKMSAMGTARTAFQKPGAPGRLTGTGGTAGRFLAASRDP